MAGAETFTCKRCGKSGDYYDMRKTLCPVTRKVVCCECAETARARMDGGPYNGSCGSKGGPGAGWDAAEQMKTRAGRLRCQCLDMIRQNGPLGADRLAFLMDEDEDNVSPRLSELVKMEMLVKGPRAAKTKRGNPAHVYQLPEGAKYAL